MQDSHPPVVIIGAGMAGLACGRDLQAAGVPVHIVEADDRPGGRVGSRSIAGFRCDVGFQVVLDAYPQVQQRLDMDALSLGRFIPGAKLYWRGKIRPMADPIRHPRCMGSSLSGPGSLLDKLRMLRLALQHRRMSMDEALASPQMSTREWLQCQGFGPQMLDHFLTPWFAGILCDRQLRASSRLFRAYFACLSQGAACLPRGGMQAIPDQLAAQLAPGTIHYGRQVVSAQANQVRCSDGSVVSARAVVVATDAVASARLLRDPAPPPGVGLRSLWFVSTVDPGIGPWIVLDGDGTGPVNHLAAPSDVCGGYAPPGQHLMVATVLGDDGNAPDLEARVRSQLRQWLGPQVDAWQCITEQAIAHAQPRQWPEDLHQAERDQRHPSGCWQCGDHRDHASIHGALASGERCARDLMQSLTQP
ncbi:MAG: FAD-dependent oxidoreductase [Planctomycetota bacterium]|nr:MAG: FAD-dependent oxidoreductase [Planctomycetota bacterium]